MLSLQFTAYSDSACTAALPSLSLSLPSVSYTSSTASACSSGSDASTSIAAQCSYYSSSNSNYTAQFFAQQYNVTGCPQGAVQRSSLQWTLSFPLSSGLAGPHNRCTLLTYFMSESSDLSSAVYGLVQCASSSNGASPSSTRFLLQGTLGQAAHIAAFATATLIMSLWVAA